MGYFVLTLPSLVLAIAAALLGLVPSWVSNLQFRPSLRYSIAAVLVALSIVSAAISSNQMRGADAQIAALESSQSQGFQGLNKHIEDFEAKTPTVPKLAFAFSDEQVAVTPRNGRLLLGLTVNITNNGDDAVYTTHYVAAFGRTPSAAGIAQVISIIRTKLHKIIHQRTEPVTLNHGESGATSAIIDNVLGGPLTPADVDALAAGANTAFFAIGLDVKTVTGLSQVKIYCGYYQGLLVVDCPAEGSYHGA